MFHFKFSECSLQNASYSNGYTLSNNNGDVIINNTEITANTGGGFAFDVCRNSSYPSVSVEVTGSSIIRGNIELYASRNDPKDGLSLKFTSGTLEGSIVMDESVIEILKTNPEKVTMLKGENAVINAPEGYHFDKDGNLKTGEAPEPEPEPDSSDDGDGVTVAIAISAVAVVVLIAAGLIIFRRQRTHSPELNRFETRIRARRDIPGRRILFPTAHLLLVRSPLMVHETDNVLLRSRWTPANGLRQGPHHNTLKRKGR